MQLCKYGDKTDVLPEDQYRWENLSDTRTKTYLVGEKGPNIALEPHESRFK